MVNTLYDVTWKSIWWNLQYVGEWRLLELAVYLSAQRTFADIRSIEVATGNKSFNLESFEQNVENDTHARQTVFIDYINEANQVTAGVRLIVSAIEFRVNLVVRCISDVTKLTGKSEAHIKVVSCCPSSERFRVIESPTIPKLNRWLLFISRCQVSC